MEQTGPDLNHYCPSALDETKHCKNVWLLEYVFNENQDDWSDLEKKADKMMLGKTPQLSIVVFGREFDIEEKGPRWRVYESDETRPGPVKQVFLGQTRLELAEFMEFYSKLSEINGHFGPGSYDFFSNNCIHFAEALSVKLVEKRLPVQYQLIVENTAIRIGAIAAGACAAMGCLCVSAAASNKIHRENNVHVGDGIRDEGE